MCHRHQPYSLQYSVREMAHWRHSAQEAKAKMSHLEYISFTEIKISSFMKQKLFSLIFLEKKHFLESEFHDKNFKNVCYEYIQYYITRKTNSVYMKLLMKLILQA